MIEPKLLAAILDSIKDPIVFVDMDHMIRYVNKAAITRFKEGASLVGRSIMDCHNEDSRRQILEILAAMHEGEEERLVTDNEKRRTYMRAVRDEAGRVIGYYERYEPPRSEQLTR
ncbi:MAG: PAS domain-containing protein [Armatimonadetes bacterium]|nr:PAS domain-containing protein [Armatimonadota bacterium]